MGAGKRFLQLAQLGGKFCNSAGKLGSKLDTRGAGGFVVVPPSVTVQPYRWETDRDPWSIPPEPAAAMAGQSARSASTGTAGAVAPTKPTAADRYGWRALESELALVVTASEGRRNHQLNRSAHALYRLVRDGRLYREDVDHALTTAAEHIGLKEREITATLDSAAKARGAVMAGSDPHEVTEKLRRKRERAERAAKTNDGEAVATMTPAVAVNPRRPTWMWYPRIPAGMITIIGAKGGSCKGLTCASMAATVTTGGMWPDSTGPAEQGDVLWCEAEDPLPEVVVPRLIAAGADLSRITFASRDAFAAEKDLREVHRGEGDQADRAEPDGLVSAALGSLVRA